MCVCFKDNGLGSHTCYNKNCWRNLCLHDRLCCRIKIAWAQKTWTSEYCKKPLLNLKAVFCFEHEATSLNWRMSSWIGKMQQVSFLFKMIEALLLNSLGKSINLSSGHIVWFQSPHLISAACYPLRLLKQLWHTWYHHIPLGGLLTGPSVLAISSCLRPSWH